MRIVVRRSVGVVMALAMGLNTACYSFVPTVSGASPKSGQIVKVRLNATGTDELARFLGPRVEYAEGMLSEVRPDGSVVVGVTNIRLLDGIDQFWSGQSVVTFAPRQVVEVQARALDKHKTRLATIGSVLGVIAVFALAFASGVSHGAGDTGSTQPPP